MFYIKTLEDSSQLERKEEIQSLDILDQTLGVHNSQIGGIRKNTTSVSLSPTDREEVVEFISVLDAATRNGLTPHVLP